MKFFAFKNHENLSDNIYDRLRTLLAEMGRPVYSLKTSRFYPNAAGFTRSQLRLLYQGLYDFHRRAQEMSKM